jgi:hypothetical protein
MNTTSSISATKADITGPMGWICAHTTGEDLRLISLTMLNIMVKLIIQPRGWMSPVEDPLGQCRGVFGWGDNFPTEGEFKELVKKLGVISEYHHGDTNPICWSWDYRDLNEGTTGGPIWELSLKWFGQWTRGRSVEFTAREDWCHIQWDSGTGNPSRFLNSYFEELVQHLDKFTDWGVD